MTLTPSQRTTLRQKILTDLDILPEVTMETRYIRPLFNDTLTLRQWCSRWGINFEIFTERISGIPVCRHGIPIEWISFAKPEPPPTLFILSDHQ